MISDRLLILSDGKPGHLNQSIAFAKHLGYDYELRRVAFRGRLAKLISYVADRLALHWWWLFSCEKGDGEYFAVVSAGSETYYANRLLAGELGIKSVAIMLPKGYRYDFDLIVAQHHDAPPLRGNIIPLPVNLSYVVPQGLVKPEFGRKYVAVIVGGDSKQGRLVPEQLREQLRQVFALFPGYGLWLTTSRRTSSEVEDMLRDFDWERAVFYSKEPINPIPDFLAQSDYVFLTADSTSMISEAVSYGTACVEVLPASGTAIASGKFGRMVDDLQKQGAVHIFNGEIGSAHGKINLSSLLSVAGWALDSQ